MPGNQQHGYRPGRDDCRWARLERDLAGELAAEPSITCPRCGMTSHHPVDVAEGYCGNCHDWTSARTPPAQPHAPPAEHG